MKSILLDLRRALVATLILTLVCCGLYPLIVTCLARSIFPKQAEGSLIRDASGTLRGSTLIGQNFTAPTYFHPRPSAAGPNGYDGNASSGSNLGPTSQKLADQIRDRIASYRTENQLDPQQSIPADAVTASGSGLDPHISPANATLQASRVAKARNLPLEQILTLIRQNTDPENLGLLGDPGVNVLKLNLALDSLPR